MLGEQTIQVKVRTLAEKMSKENSLQILSDHLGAEALYILAEISKRKDAEEKLLQNQRLIKSFLQ